MSAQEATSELSVFKIDGKNRLFRTVTTLENKKIKKTVFQQEIDKKTYNERFSTNPTLVTESDGKYYTIVRTETRDNDGNISGTDSIYADLNFQKAFEKRGKSSLLKELEIGQDDALKKATGITDSTFRKQQQTTKHNAIGSATDFINKTSAELNNVKLNIEGKRRTKYDNLYYPQTIASSKQDRIRFSMRYISDSRDINFDLNGSSLGLGKRKTTGINGSVTLPIPGGISDYNNVKYDNDSLDVLGALGFGALLNPMGALEGGAELIGNALNSSPDQLRDALGGQTGSNILSALRIRLAEMGMGRSGMSSRIGGGILNPNMELLFSAPAMRTFNFSFTMSARSQTEATQIKKIIRFFKQGMSVKRDANNIFIVSPNTFTINYILGNTGNDHPSIGRIKECALTDLNTTYGDGSTYMTFDDPDRTMTTYKIDMTFKELDPITEDDYLGEENTSTGPLADPDQAFIGKNEVPLDHIGY